MTSRKPLSPAMKHPAHPERICWGCPQLCAADDLGCANGTTRTQHPGELFGEDWEEWFDRNDGSRHQDERSHP